MNRKIVFGIALTLLLTLAFNVQFGFASDSEVPAVGICHSSNTADVAVSSTSASFYDSWWNYVPGDTGYYVMAFGTRDNGNEGYGRIKLYEMFNSEEFEGDVSAIDFQLTGLTMGQCYAAEVEVKIGIAAKQSITSSDREESLIVGAKASVIGRFALSDVWNLPRDGWFSVRTSNYRILPHTTYVLICETLNALSYQADALVGLRSGGEGARACVRVARLRFQM